MTQSSSCPNWKNIIIAVVSMLLLIACNPNPCDDMDKEFKCKTTKELSLPNDVGQKVASLLCDINNSARQEHLCCDYHAPTFIISGQTMGYVFHTRSRLNELGYDAKWDKTKGAFILAKHNINSAASRRGLRQALKRLANLSLPAKFIIHRSAGFKTNAPPSNKTMEVVLSSKFKFSLPRRKECPLCLYTSSDKAQTMVKHHMIVSKSLQRQVAYPTRWRHSQWISEHILTEADVLHTAEGYFMILQTSLLPENSLHVPALWLKSNVQMKLYSSQIIDGVTNSLNKKGRSLVSTVLHRIRKNTDTEHVLTPYNIGVDYSLLPDIIVTLERGTKNPERIFKLSVKLPTAQNPNGGCSWSEINFGNFKFSGKLCKEAAKLLKQIENDKALFTPPLHTAITHG